METWARNINSRYPIYRQSDNAKIAACLADPAISPIERERNLSIIAAAPELLALCKSTLNWIREYHSQNGEFIHDEGLAMLDADLRAAIAKAEYKTHIGNIGQ